MIGQLILWTYVWGLIPAAVIAARWLGLKWTQLAKGYDKGFEMSGWTCLVVCAVGLWPVTLLVLPFYRSGISAGQRQQETEKQLAEANAELDKIRRKEGWL